jgi:magnesium-transporting ATPase (P-type)
MLTQVDNYLDSKTLFVIFLDLLATTIPPTLPTAMSVGIGFAIQSLTNMNIKCMVPPKIIVGGRSDTVCFEKTGAITKK